MYFLPYRGGYLLIYLFFFFFIKISSTEEKSAIVLLCLVLFEEEEKKNSIYSGTSFSVPLSLHNSKLLDAWVAFLPRHIVELFIGLLVDCLRHPFFSMLPDVKVVCFLKKPLYFTGCVEILLNLTVTKADVTVLPPRVIVLVS